MWAGKQRRVTSTAFRHADLTAIMGGIELDLRQAATDDGEAVVDLFVMWGGVEIWVPPDWAVSNQVGLLMGGAEDKSSGRQDARHRLIVRGFCLMGGIEIKT
jgi:predicted membrane protein